MGIRGNTKPTQADRQFHKPAYYRDLSGKSADYIRSKIASGELRAYDFSEGSRADWWIHEDDWAAFIATKANVKSEPDHRDHETDVGATCDSRMAPSYV